MSSSTKEDTQKNEGSVKEARKFMFETHDFGDEDALAVLKADEEIEPSYSQEELETVRAESLAAGKAQGIEEAKNSLEATIAQIIAQISAMAQELIAAENRREEEKFKMATHMAVGITRKLLPGLAQKLAQSEIEALIAEAVENRHNEPRIVIRVHDSLLDALKPRLDEISTQQGFSGQLILMTDEDLQPTDCRLEWADGGTEKLFDVLYSRIERLILKTVGGEATPIPDAPAEETVAEEGDASHENPPETAETPDVPEGEEIENSEDSVETTDTNA